MIPRRPVAVICTTTAVEYAAVRDRLTGVVTEQVEDGLRQAVATHPGHITTGTAVVVQVGLDPAGSMSLLRLVNRLEPQVILFVGIASGLRGTQVGDVVIAREVHQYMQVLGALERREVVALSEQLARRALQVSAKGTWLHGALAKSPRPAAVVRPVALVSRLMSGHSQVARILESSPNAAATEMGNRGELLRELMTLGAEVLLVRGICETAAGDAKNDGLSVAARHAATFAIELLATTGDRRKAVYARRQWPVPRQLPAVVPTFVGRDEKLAELTAALDNADGGLVLTLTGMAGVGKTCLAVRWAYQHQDRFPDGTLFINLRGFGPFEHLVTSEQAVRSFLDALGVSIDLVPHSPEAQEALYRRLVADRRMLVVLDNAANIDQVRPLLPGGGACTTLVIGRNRLPELTVHCGALPLTLDVLTNAESHELLTEYLGLDRVAEAPAATSELVERCAGLPLALAVLAGRLRLHSRRSIAQFTTEFRTIVELLRDDDPWANVASVLSWSVQALTEEQRTALFTLSVAIGPDIGVAAATNLLASEQPGVETVLRGLENASLLSGLAPGRWSMHELIREHVGDLAVANLPVELRESALRRLTEFYLHTAHNADRVLSQRKEELQLEPLGPQTLPIPVMDVEDASAWFDAEYHCLLQAQQHALRLGWPRGVLQLAEVMDTYQRRRGTLDDHLRCWCSALHAAIELDDLRAVALAYRMAGIAFSRAGDQQAALEHLSRALDVVVGDEANATECYRALATVWERFGDDEQALRHAELALRFAAAHGDVLAQAGAQNAIGRYHIRLGHFESGRTCCEAALELYRYHPHRTGEADAWHNLGDLAHRVGEHRESIDCLTRALDLRRDLGDFYEQANLLLALGDAQAALGREGEAQESWELARDLFTGQRRVDAADEAAQRLWRAREEGRDAEQVTVYTSGDDGTALRDAVVDLLEAAGYVITAQQDPERGSWFQKLFVRRRNPDAAERLVTAVENAVTNEVATTKVGSVVQAGQISFAHAPALTNDERLVNSIARLLEAAHGHENVAVLLPPLLLIKVGPVVVSWQPTAEEWNIIEANPQLRLSPRELATLLGAMPEDRDSSA